MRVVKILFIAIPFFAGAAQADVDISFVNGANYQPVSGTYCGVHIEPSGRTL